MQDFWLYIVVLVVVLQTKRILTFFNLCKARISDAVWEPCPREALPGYLRRILDSAEPALTDMGFERVETWRQPSALDESSGGYNYADLYWHEAQATLAWVGKSGPLTGKISSVHFQTKLADGRDLLTVNRTQWLLLPTRAQVEVADPYADTLAAHWEVHQQRLLAAGAACQPVRDLELVKAAESGASRSNYEHLVQAGFAAREDAVFLRLTLRGAWRYMLQITRIPPAMREAQHRLYVEPGSIDRRAIVDRDLHTLCSSMALAKEPLPLRLKLAVFAATLVLGTLAFSSQMELSYVGLLMLALLVHEGGHWLAMRLCGYENVSVFFLPLFGAATTGHKPNATPMQEVFVSLAGPLGGLLLACALLFLPAEALPPVAVGPLRQFISVSFFLNLFNLLPFGILDGGKVVETAVLGRFPYARLAFKVLGVLAGLAFAYAFQSTMFAFFMIILALGLRNDLAVAKVVKGVFLAVRKTGVLPLTQEQVISTLGDALTDDRYHPQKPDASKKRQAIARQALVVLQKPLPGLITALAGIFLLGLIWVLALGAAVTAINNRPSVPLWKPTVQEQAQLRKEAGDAERERLSSPEAQELAAQNQAFVAQYEAEKDILNKWQMLDAHAREIGSFDDDQDAQLDPAHLAWVNTQRQSLLRQLPDDHPARIAERAYQAIGLAENAVRNHPLSQPALDALETSISELTQHGRLSVEQMEKSSQMALEQVLSTLVRHGSTPQISAHLPEFEALFQLGVGRDPDQSLLTPSLAVHAFYLAGQREKADQLMKTYVDAATRAPLASASDPAESVRRGVQIEAVRQEYGWYLIDTGRAEEALGMATEPGRDSSMQESWAELAGWANMALKRYAAAEKFFAGNLEARRAQSEQLKAAMGQGGWLQRKLLGTDGYANRANLAALDLYIVQLHTNPAAAQELLTRYTDWNRLDAMALYFDGTHWGKERADAYREALVTLKSLSSKPPARN